MAVLQSYRLGIGREKRKENGITTRCIIPGFSLTFEVEGHWLVSRQVPCKTEGRRPESLGGSGGMVPRKIFRTEVSQECIFLQCGKEVFAL